MTVQLRRLIRGYIQIIRPLNLGILFVAVFLGGFVSGKISPLQKLLLACLSATLIGAGGNAINDVFDVEIDKINKPSRPLPQGLLSLPQAIAYSIFLFLLGFFLSVWIHVYAMGIAWLCSCLLFLYSWKLKQTVLWGNLTVAFLGGMAFLYGGLAVGNIRTSLWIALFAFLFHWAREIMKDIEDIPGDKALDVHTLPIRYGILTAIVWITGILVVLIGCTLLPYFLGDFSLAYLVSVLLSVDLVLIAILISMWKNPTPSHLGKLAVFMKWDMFAGLLSAFLGRFA